MPLYEYHCAKCDEAFDAFSSMKDRNTPKTCPSCGCLACREEIPQEGAQLDFTGGYQMKAILRKTGEQVAGHFGKYATVRKSGKAPFKP